MMSWNVESFHSIKRNNLWPLSNINRLLELQLLLGVLLLMLQQKQDVHRKWLEQWVLHYLFAHCLVRSHQTVWDLERWNLVLELYVISASNLVLDTRISIKKNINHVKTLLSLVWIQ